MSDLSANLHKLLSTEKVVTLHRTEEGFVVGVSEIELDNGSLFFVPEQLLVGGDDLEDCVRIFSEYLKGDYLLGHAA